MHWLNFYARTTAREGLLTKMAILLGGAMTSLRVFCRTGHLSIRMMVRMEIYDVMRTTGAVRKFSGEPLSDEVLERILDNARFAPSGGNRQGARVIAVRDVETRKKLGELSKPGARQYVAQIAAGEGPWNPLRPCGVDPAVVEATPVPDGMVSGTLLGAGFVLLFTVPMVRTFNQWLPLPAFIRIAEGFTMSRKPSLLRSPVAMPKRSHHCSGVVSTSPRSIAIAKLTGLHCSSASSTLRG